MKRLFLIFILTLSFQSLTKADDISDFEIEEMSVGESLLNYMDENWMSKRIRSFESEFIELAEEEEFITNSLETFYYYKPYRFSDQNMLS